MTKINPEPLPPVPLPSWSEREAIRLLLEQRSVLYGFIFALLRDHDGAEEIFQEVSLAICESWNDFEPGTNFGAWTREIARRRIFAHLRQKARFPLMLSDEGLARIQMGFEEICDQQPDLIQDRIGALRQCLKTMQPKARWLIELRYEARKSLLDMAAEMRRQPESVRKALYRTRLMLKDCIERRLKTGNTETR